MHACIIIMILGNPAWEMYMQLTSVSSISLWNEVMLGIASIIGNKRTALPFAPHAIYTHTKPETIDGG